MPTLDELGQKVKAKYPGVYDDMPDADVAQKVQAKFPGKYDDFSEPTQADFADVVGGSSAPTPFQQQAKSRFAALEASAPPQERLGVKNAIADTRAFAAKPLINVSHAIGMDDPDKMAAISNVLDPATVLAGTAGIKAAEGFTSPEAIAGIVSPTIGLAQAAHGATQLPGQIGDAYRDLKSGDVSRFLTESGPAAASNLAMTTALGVGHGRGVARKVTEPATRLDFDAVNRESMGEVARPMETRIEAPETIKAPPERTGEPMFTGIDEPQTFDVSPEKPLEVSREIQDAAAGHAEKPTDVEIQEAARQLDKLDRAAAEGQPAEAAPGENGAGRGAVGSLGEAAGAQGERAADPAARSGGPAEAGAPEAGNPRDVQRQAEAGQAAPGAEGVPVEGEPDLTHRSIRDFQRAANVPEYEGSRFSRSNQGIRDAVQGNEAALVERGRRAKVGEALSDEVQYALKQYTDNLVRNGGDPAEIKRNYQILAESGSAKGRQLQALQTAIDQVDHTDPAAVVQLANKVTQGKLSIQAQMDLADMAKKASKMKEASDASINKRAEAALARLEGMGEQIKKLTIKDVIGCR